MRPGFWDHVRNAFNARPIGMFVPPNWIGLGLFGLLGFVDPGFLLIGAGLELAYLGVLASNPRFQKTVVSSRLSESQKEAQAKVNSLVAQLGGESQARYRLLETRCRSILEQQLRLSPINPGLDAQGEGLGRLSWIYLRLLLTRQSIDRILKDSLKTGDDTARLQERIDALENRIKDEALGEELRKSLRGQVEILQQRLEKRGEARDKLAFLDAELTRIQEQVELIREQAVLSTDPEVVSQRIDQITSTLGGTTQWIREQQKIYGAMEDLLAEPPPITANTAAKESQ